MLLDLYTVLSCFEQEEKMDAKYTTHYRPVDALSSHKLCHLRQMRIATRFRIQLPLSAILRQGERKSRMACTVGVDGPECVGMSKPVLPVLACRARVRAIPASALGNLRISTFFICIFKILDQPPSFTNFWFHYQSSNNLADPLSYNATLFTYQ